MRNWNSGQRVRRKDGGPVMEVVRQLGETVYCQEVAPRGRDRQFKDVPQQEVPSDDLVEVTDYIPNPPRREIFGKGQ